MMSPIIRYFEEGFLSGLTGRSIDECPRYRSDRRAEWRRGHHAGQRRREEQQAAPTARLELSETARGELARMRAIVARMPGEDGDFWSRQYRTETTAHLWRANGRSACGRLWWPRSNRLPLGGDVERCPDCEREVSSHVKAENV